MYWSNQLSMLILILFSTTVTSQIVDPIERLLLDIWAFEIQVEPEKASDYGESRYNHQLVDRSSEGMEAINQQRKNYLIQLNHINQKSLGFSRQIDIALMQHELENYIDKYEYKHHYIPFNADMGFYSEILFLPRYPEFNSTKDYEDYLQRLAQIKRLIFQNITWLKQGLATGYTQPQQAIQGIEHTVAAIVTEEVTASPFYQPFLNIPKHLTQQRWQQRGQQLITEQIHPAFIELARFLKEEYIPNARTSLGLSSFKWGIEYYNNRIKHFTTTTLTAAEIHHIGLQEVKRIREQMLTIMQKVDFKGNLSEFFTFLRTAPQFYVDKPEQLLKEATFIAKKMDYALPQLFGRLPRTPYGVLPVPDSIAPKFTAGRYINSSKSSEAGTYWLNTYALNKRPLYTLEALTFHEAVPGHHLQIALAQEQTNVLPHRKSFAISAFDEGWALYSEELGLEVGFYTDPYSNFGRLTYEMWRACRLVVDTGIHLQQWTRQQAINYMQENTALSLINITTEVDRYITWPGQALSYKIGQINIKKLRAQAEQQLGAQFDKRRFHDAILEHGSIPLSVLERVVAEYIHQEQKN